MSEIERRKGEDEKMRKWEDEIMCQFYNYKIECR